MRQGNDRQQWVLRRLELFRADLHFGAHRRERSVQPHGRDLERERRLRERDSRRQANERNGRQRSHRQRSLLGPTIVRCFGPTAKPPWTDREAALDRPRSLLGPTAKPPWTDPEVSLDRRSSASLDLVHRVVRPADLRVEQERIVVPVVLPARRAADDDHGAAASTATG